MQLLNVTESTFFCHRVLERLRLLLLMTGGAQILTKRACPGLIATAMKALLLEMFPIHGSSRFSLAKPTLMLLVRESIRIPVLFLRQSEARLVNDILFPVDRDEL